MFAGWSEAGDFLFMCLVIISNARVLISSHEISVVPVVLQIACFVLYTAQAVAVTEIFTTDAQYKTYYHIFRFPSMYFALILFTFVFSATDKIILSLRREHKKYKIIKMQEAERLRKEQDARSGRSITRRVTMYKRKSRLHSSLEDLTNSSLVIFSFRHWLCVLASCRPRHLGHNETGKTC